MGQSGIPEAVVGVMQFIILAQQSDCDCPVCKALRKAGKDMADRMTGEFISKGGKPSGRARGSA